MAVLNLTMESAPTIPSETTMFDCMVRMIDAVIIAIARMDILKFLL